MTLKEKITLRVEVLLIEANAIAAFCKSKKFKALSREKYSEKLEVYEERWFELQAEINGLLRSVTESVHIWSAVMTKPKYPA